MPARRPASQVQRAHAFGERIRGLRRAKKLKQREVAELLPMSPGHLSRIETGDYGPPSDEVIERLAEVLEADTLELLRIAGRETGSDAFQQRVLAELAEIRTDIARLERAVTPRRR
ncbi:MAG TPA: helix-turn-helix transcriptional regulator [Solirubrobacteraceae bacterium]|nr:helix-turn-helix transcriptional regulator [Solirubrobacteraceae bacterium]